MGNLVAVKALTFIGALLGLGKMAVPEQLKRPFWKRVWGRPSRPKSMCETVMKGHCYNKSILRINARSKITRHKPPTPTSSTLTSGDGRCSYRIWSDGSYRRMVKTTGTRLIPV
jgi:hypothetical protein